MLQWNEFVAKRFQTNTPSCAQVHLRKHTLCPYQWRHVFLTVFHNLRHNLSKRTVENIKTYFTISESETNLSGRLPTCPSICTVLRCVSCSLFSLLATVAKFMMKPFADPTVSSPLLVFKLGEIAMGAAWPVALWRISEHSPLQVCLFMAIFRAS